MVPIRTPRISGYWRQRIVFLRNIGKFPTEIQSILKNEGLMVSRQAITATILKFARTGSLADLPRPGRPLGYKHVVLAIDCAMKRNNESTSTQLLAHLKSCYPDASLPSFRTIQRLRNRLGWHYASVKYCQIVRDANKPRRLVFSAKAIHLREQFDACCFSDETTIQLERHKSKTFIKRGQRVMSLASRAKHPVKVHVWAGISRKGATAACIFDGKHRMNSKDYCQILGKFFLPFVQKLYPEGNVYLVQDNAPTHTSRETKQFFAEAGIKTMRWPAESPDINPIEKLWHQLKEHLRSYVKPANKSELISGIQQFWGQVVTPELCNRYIDGIPKVLKAVLENDGGPTIF